MSALGLLIPYLIYIFLGLSFLASVFYLYKFPTRRKVLPLIFCALSILTIIQFKSCQNNNYKESQLSQVGKYFLINYPNCNSCILELKENQTYSVIDSSRIIEEADWHYEVGGDYFITYMDNNKHHLGNGKFAYKGFAMKYKTK